MKFTESVQNPAWTSKHLDGCKVRIQKKRRLAKDCYLIEQVYDKKDN